MPTTLEQILATTRDSIAVLRAHREEVERLAADARPRPGLLSRWDRARLALVAEVKRRSPSAGNIRQDLDPASHASIYWSAGASAISVLTDQPYFGGSLDDLAAVAAAVPAPLLRKDFILEELQIAEARAAGASAVLLIVRALGPERLRALLAAARDWELDTLVEVHDDRELAIALDSDSPVIGVNSRNLDTFEIDLAAAWGLVGRIPADRVAIAESGLATESDVRRAAAAGADGVLMGTALSSVADPSSLARQVQAVPRTGR
jgi:indole-3-glycerol phosphate synthase